MLVVGDDSGAALLVSPAGLARRDMARGRIAVGLGGEHASFLGDDPASPEVVNRGGARALPSVSLAESAGPLVVGFALIVGQGEHTTLPAPAFDTAVDSVARLYPHRYGGFTLDYARHAIAAGGAWRATDWLALGASLSGAWVKLSEQRMVWAGDPVLDPQLSPADDLLLSVEGTDNVVPGGALGVLIVPPKVPVEIAASARYRMGTHIDDSATLSPTREGQMLIAAGASDASIDLPAALTSRGGVRYLGGRITAEVAAAYTVYLGDSTPSWETDLAIMNPIRSEKAAITSVPSALAADNQLTVGGSVDIAAAPGLLWLTAGYAYATGKTDESHVAPTRVGLATHTVGIGAEAYFDGTTLAIGYSRSFANRRAIAADQTAVRVIAPFDSAPSAAAPGDYDTAEDRAALTVEVTW